MALSLVLLLARDWYVNSQDQEQCLCRRGTLKPLQHGLQDKVLKGVINLLYVPIEHWPKIAAGLKMQIVLIDTFLSPSSIKRT